jgi:hypothetical protein
MKWVEPLNEWKELFILSFDDKWHLSLQISPLFIGFLTILVVIVFLLKLKGGKFWHRYDVVEGEIPIAGLGKVKIKPNNETIHIAYQAWTELITRKVALPYDEDNDVIVEVYNSWYSAFGILRELAKNIPAHKLRNDKNSKELVDVMITVLNKGLRPHLTKWQARFRRWYQQEKEAQENVNLSPQEIQKKYAEYRELVKDMKTVNQIMLKYAEWLEKIFKGK